MVRLHFKDGSYMDVLPTEVHLWEMDPNLDRVEQPDQNELFFDDYVRMENGK